VFAAKLAHDSDPEELAIIAHCDRDVYLVSVGAGCARILDLRPSTPSFSDAEDIYALMAGTVDWLPFEGDPEVPVTTAARMIAAGR
jgi:hypothetical protein